MISAGLAALTGWLDFHATEVQPTVLILLVTTGVLGYIAPRQAWLTALMLGLSIAITYVIARAAGIQPVEPLGPLPSTLLALIPAGIGAGVGAGLRLIPRRAPDSQG